MTITIIRVGLMHQAGDFRLNVVVLETTFIHYLLKFGALYHLPGKMLQIRHVINMQYT